MTLVDPSPVRRRRFGPVYLIPVFALIALVCWGLSSPVGSSPDEDFHLASIWCGSGHVAGQCAAATDAAEREVPADLVDSSVCYAYQDAESAACQTDDFGTTPDETVATDRGNFEGLYPPVFYFVMSAFAGPNVDVSVVAIRIANSVLFVGLMTILCLLLPARRRPPVVIAAVVTVVPLGLFLLPSANPSSWAIISAAILWASLVGYYESSGARRVALGTLAVLAGVIGAGARSDSAVYVGLAAVAVAVLTFERSRRYLLLSILPATLLVLSFFVYLSSRQSDIASTGFDIDSPLDVTPAVLFVANLVKAPELWTGMFGSDIWGLGWLDTQMPALVWASAFLCFGFSVLVGISRGGRRKFFATSIVFAAFWLIPVVILVQSRALVGTYLQPRYILPIAVILVGVALWNGRGSISISLPQRLFVVAALSVANAVALNLNIRRYVTGTDVAGFNLDSGVEWWWPGLAISPMGVFAIGSVAFAVMLVMLERYFAGMPTQNLTAAGTHPQKSEPPELG